MAAGCWLTRLPDRPKTAMGVHAGGFTLAEALARAWDTAPVLPLCRPCLMRLEACC